MFQIFGTYKGKTEILDEFDTIKMAELALIDYRMAFGNQWTIWITEDV